uniref:uncharacterized protein LOC122597005 n=1 Tax=Erigeron canadensis TaxID=72917 RepID=UPI001CB974E9|nr:uncharacterized protein LOC122597005 [Erigeron canadensis]
MFLEKFSPSAEVEKLKEEFLTIDQGEMSISEYTGLFNDKSRFCPEFTLNPKLLCNHYHRHMKPEISEFIDTTIYDDMPKMMNRALARERELHRKASDVAGKRRIEEMSSSSYQAPIKKVRFEGKSQQQPSPQQSRQQFKQQSQQVRQFRQPQQRPQTYQQPRVDCPVCNQCGRRHLGECKFGKSCYRCASTEHLGKDCPIPYRLCFYCFGDDHLKADCPKMKEDNRKAEQKKRETGKNVHVGGSRPRARAFQITTEDTKESHDVVTGTFIVNSMPAHVLFDSGAFKSFVSSSFCEKFKLPLCKLDFPLEVVVAAHKSVVVNDVYKDCSIEINDELFKTNLIPMETGEFHVVIGMDWLGDHGELSNVIKRLFSCADQAGRR